MSLIADRCLKRTFLVQEMYESWQLARADETFEFDFVEIVEECVELCRLLVRMVDPREPPFFPGTRHFG